MLKVSREEVSDWYGFWYHMGWEVASTTFFVWLFSAAVALTSYLIVTPVYGVIITWEHVVPVAFAIIMIRELVEEPDFIAHVVLACVLVLAGSILYGVSLLC